MILWLEWVLHIKKEPKYKEQKQKDRGVFMDMLQKIAPKDVVYCDEVGVESNIAPIYGWSEKGKRSYVEREGRSKERRNIVAGYNSGKLVAPLEYVGNTNTSIFLDWIEEHLCPVLVRGQTVILDNASFHKSSKIREAIEKVGCKVLYLPPYSPDLNPIEHCWANFKNCLRKIRRKFNDLKSAITKAMQITFPV